MLDIRHARPTAKKILSHIDDFEKYCMGETYFSPSKFRQINEELSIGAILMLGKCRYQSEQDGTRLFWHGTDQREHDLGLINEIQVMRDLPGFHAKRSISLGSNMVESSKTITKGKTSVCIVTMKDGNTGVGPDYRMALRNAALKMHLTAKFNYFSLSDLWSKFWHHGNA